MVSWLLIVMFVASDDIKFREYPTKQACESAMPQAITQWGKNPKVLSIGCYPSEKTKSGNVV